MKRYFLFLFFSMHLGLAQTPIYHHFGVDEGLPSSEVYDVYQDKQGYIWFATDKGLSRYNGYEFENFTKKDGLPGNTILGFYPQNDGRVFCMEHHSNTLFYFDEIFEGFKVYPFSSKLKKYFPSNAVVKSIRVKENGSIILGGYTIKGFIEISNQGKVSYTYDKDLYPEIFYSERIDKLRIGFFYNTHAYGFLYHDYKSDENLFSFPIENYISSRLNVTKINKDEFAFIDSKLGVVSTSGSVRYFETQQNPIGIKRVDDTRFMVGYYSNGAEIRATTGAVIESFLPNNSVSNFLIDAEGSYWFSTLDDGVFYIKNPQVKVFSNDNIVSLVKDNTATLFTGHHNGDISSINNLKQKLLYKGLKYQPAFVEFNSDRSEIYGASDSFLLNFTKKQKPATIYNSRKLAEDVVNPLINVASVHFYSIENDSLKDFKVGLRTEDVCFIKDTIFIATPSGLYFKKGDTIQAYHKSPLFTSRLYDIDFNKKTNKAYMASQDYGVIVKGDSLYAISKFDGLTNNLVSEVYIENDSTVWACQYRIE
ncbi:MAG: two-component regulator propeller domain-containing protein [Flavobacteriaceae bacterium]